MENFVIFSKRCIENGWRIAFMESCTSGLLSSLFTDTEGASAVFKGSFVTYSNEEKIQQGVSPEIIDKFGVYSSECAQAMAKAAQNHFCSDISVGVTGTAGNLDPENSDSVLGNAFFCIRVKSGILKNSSEIAALAKTNFSGNGFKNDVADATVDFEKDFTNFNFVIAEDVKFLSRAEIKMLYAKKIYDKLLEITSL